MKRLFASIYIVFLSGCTGVPTQSSTPIGFRGAMLGSAPLPGMQPLEKWIPKEGRHSREISDAYTRPEESHELGELTIQRVTYEYHKSRLFRVEVDLWKDGQKRCPMAHEVVKALESQFGISMTRYSEDFASPSFLYQWRSRDAWVTYICSPVASLNLITIHSPAAQLEVDASLKEISKANDDRAIEKIRRGLK